MTNDLKAMIVFFKAYKEVVEAVKEDVKKYDFDINEFSVLEVIYHKKCLSVQEIKDKILVANSSLTYILDKLEKKELILRIKDEKDKRVYYVELSEKGKKISNKIFSEHYEVMKKYFCIFTEEERDNFIYLMKKLGYNAKELGEK